MSFANSALAYGSDTHYIFFFFPDKSEGFFHSYNIHFYFPSCLPACLPVISLPPSFILKTMFVCAQSLHSRPTLCDHTDWSPSGCSVHGILQARILEWVAMPSSRGSSRPRDRALLLFRDCLLLCRQIIDHRATGEAPSMTTGSNNWWYQFIDKELNSFFLITLSFKRTTVAYYLQVRRTILSF